jgi:hypothetical protein
MCAIHAHKSIIGREGAPFQVVPQRYLPFRVATTIGRVVALVMPLLVLLPSRYCDRDSAGLIESLHELLCFADRRLEVR